MRRPDHRTRLQNTASNDSFPKWTSRTTVCVVDNLPAPIRIRIWVVVARKPSGCQRGKFGRLSDLPSVVDRLSSVTRAIHFIIAMGMIIFLRSSRWHFCPVRNVAKPLLNPRTTSERPRHPEEVKDELGYALYVAQRGGNHVDAKPLHRFGGARILEIVKDQAGDTCRISVLHVFQKKSKTGIKTPKPEIELIKSGLKRARRRTREMARLRKAGRPSTFFFATCLEWVDIDLTYLPIEDRASAANRRRRPEVSDNRIARLRALRGVVQCF